MCFHSNLSRSRIVWSMMHSLLRGDFSSAASGLCLWVSITLRLALMLDSLVCVSGQVA